MPFHFDDPAQQEIWRVVRALNDAWTQGDPADLDEFFHPDMIAVTPIDRHRLEGRAACIASWQRFVDAVRIRHWAEHAPTIRVYGDSAVVAYDFEISYDLAQQRFDVAGRDLFFFVRQGGRWQVVADQFSSYPA